MHITAGYGRPPLRLSAMLYRPHFDPGPVWLTTRLHDVTNADITTRARNPGTQPRAATTSVTTFVRLARVCIDAIDCGKRFWPTHTLGSHAHGHTSADAHSYAHAVCMSALEPSPFSCV